MLNGWVWIDKNNPQISARKIVLYGAGNNSINLAEEYRIENILAVVDRDKKKQEKSIILFNNTYKVESIDVLSKINIDDTLVVISLCDIEKNKIIQKEIYSKYKKWRGRVISWTELGKEYLDIESALLCDSDLMKRAQNTNISSNIVEYLGEAKKIIQLHIKKDLNGLRFLPTNKGSRVSIIIRNENEKYILFFQSKKDEKYYYDKNIITSSKIAEQLELNKSIIIYDNYKGLKLYKYIENDSHWTEKKVEKVLQAIKRIHESGYCNHIDSDIWSGISRIQNEIGDNIIDKNTLNNLYGCIREETEKHNKVLIHGDFCYGNVIVNKENIEIIDWEYMSMGDATYDVMYFYYRLKETLIINLDYYLLLYYKRKPNAEELKHAKAWLCTIVYLQYIIAIKQHKEALLLKDNLLHLVDDYMNDIAE